MDSEEELRNKIPNVLIVGLVKAENLQAGDRGGVSDPYAVIRLGKKQKFESRVVSNTVNPTWGQQVKFKADNRVTDAETMLTVHVYDRDLLTKQLLGKCRIKLGDLPLHRAVNMTCDLLEPFDKSFTRGGQGQLFLTLEWTFVEGGGVRVSRGLFSSQETVLAEHVDMQEVVGDFADLGEEGKKELEEEKKAREEAEQKQADLMERVVIRKGECVQRLC